MRALLLLSLALSPATTGCRVLGIDALPCVLDVDCPPEQGCVRDTSTCAPRVEGEGEGEDVGEGEGEGEGELEGFQRWHPLEPNNSLDVEHCLDVMLVPIAYLSPGDWNDELCDRGLPYVCDLPAAPIDTTCAIETINGQVRALCAEFRTWEDARLQCESLGGALTTITNADDNDAVIAAGQINFNDADRMWLGASDLDAEGVWRWLDGALIPVERFIAWAPNRPNDDSASENCLGLMLDSEPVEETRLLWNDVLCSDLRPFVCEAPVGAPAPAGCTAENIGVQGPFFLCDGRPYAQAQNICAAVGGLLLRDTHAAFHEDLLVAAELRFPDEEAIFLGADDIETEGVFVWNDGGLVEMPPP